MNPIPHKPERTGQDPAAALDDALATYLDGERQNYQEAVEGIRKGYEDIKAGHTRPASEFLEEMRQTWNTAWRRPRKPSRTATRFLNGCSRNMQVKRASAGL